MSLRDQLNPVSVQRACCLETSLQFLKLNKQAERSAYSILSWCMGSLFC